MRLAYLYTPFFKQLFSNLDAKLWYCGFMKLCTVRFSVNLGPFQHSFPWV